MPLLPSPRLEVIFGGVDEFDKPGWLLLAGPVKRYMVVERARWRWEICQVDRTPFHPDRKLELEVALPTHRLWPTEQAFDQQVETIRQSCGSWLAAFLPWTPLLICALCREESTPHRQAYLSILFLGLTSPEIPELRQARFHLQRLAFLALAEMDEKEEAESRRQEWLPLLHRTVYGWQEEIVRAERGGFFAQGYPTVPPDALEPAHKMRAVYEARDSAGVHLLREEAMADLLTVGSGPSRLRRLLRETVWGRDVVRSLIQGWFLPHSDLVRAEQLKAAVDSASKKTGQSGELRSAQHLARLAAWCRSVILFLAIIYVLLSLRILSPWLTWLPGKWVVGAVYLFALGEVSHWVWGGWPDTSLPRLRAGILLAVVGTLLQQNWSNLLAFAYMHPLSMSLVSAGFILAAYQALIVKIGVGIGWLGYESSRGSGWRWRGLPHRRAQALLGRALSTSFAFSLLLVDLMGDSYVDKVPDLHAGAWWLSIVPGWVTGTYPALVLLFTAILLFAGIFSQLLWEDKPITEAVA